MKRRFIFEDRPQIKMIHPEDLQRHIKVKDCKLKILEYHKK